MLIETILFFP